MPIYEYKCKNCGNIIEKYLLLEDYKKPIICETCQVSMSKIYSKISLGFVNKFKDIERKSSEEGFIINEPGLNKDAKRAREYQEEKRRKSIRKTVEQTVMDHVI